MPWGFQMYGGHVTMRVLLLLMVLLAYTSAGMAQVHTDDAESRPLRASNALETERFPVDSPLSHLTADQFRKTALPGGICPLFFYYQNQTPSYYFHEENLPTSEWAMWAPAISPLTQASVCTVWTVRLDFELLNAPATAKDTIKIFVRNGNPPYNSIYNTYFIARSGQNQGNFEIDPPVVPPFNVRSIMNAPFPPLLIGFKVVGDSTHKVKFRFTTPSLSSSPHHSYKFTSPTTISPASTVLGVSVDFVFESRICCDKYIPVELSTFNALLATDAVQLHWRTETETNNFSFEVLRAPSREGPWDSRGFLAGHGTTTEPQEYEYRDRLTAEDRSLLGSELWYRLVQRDFDGTKYEYAPIQVMLGNLAESGFEMFPAYPNPMRMSDGGVARIRYRVPEQAIVRISVHDALGRELAVLSDNMHEAGIYENVWYPQDRSRASGQYFIRMQAGTTVQTQKLSVIH